MTLRILRAVLFMRFGSTQSQVFLANEAEAGQSIITLGFCQSAPTPEIVETADG